MRKKERINTVIKLLADIWKTYPDMRFFQLIYVAQTIFSRNNQNYGRVDSIDREGITAIGYDLFNVEDEEVINLLCNLSELGIERV